MRTVGVVLAVWLAGAVEAQVSAEDVLAASMRFHDPEGQWAEGAWVMEFDETRAAGIRKTVIEFDNAAGWFELDRPVAEGRLHGRLDRDGCTITLDGSETIPDEVREKNRMTCEGLGWWRDYYLYLWGMPMKLRDPGTRVDDSVERTGFQGRTVDRIRVTYDPEVGGDIWDFYFEPETHALVGYRFFHDESKNDGEYVVLEGLETGGGLTLPKTRTWAYNDDGEYLGTDTVTAIRSLR